MIIRKAVVEDSQVLAELTSIAADGIIEALLYGLVPDVGPVEMLAYLFKTDNPSYGWKNATIAEVNHRVAGMALCYPANDFTIHHGDSLLPPDRIELMRPFEQLQCPGSYYICALAAYPEFRGQGIGARLLETAMSDARQRGFSQLSLHVFEQNVKARQLYEKFGFKNRGTAPIQSHEMLHYSGNIILMVREL